VAIDGGRRLRASASPAGRLYHSPQPVLTSARRWERDGWWRRSAKNVMLRLSSSPEWRPSGWRIGIRMHQDRGPQGREALVVMAARPPPADADKVLD
jgi:hypothetical protein